MAAPQLFRLFGYAGTGKSTLAQHLAEYVDGDVAFGAFTGKAALVMRSKGCKDARTIHSLIYRATDTETEEPSFVLNDESDAAQARSSSSSTNVRWSTRNWAAISSPSARRCWCSAIRRNCRL